MGNPVSNVIAWLLGSAELCPGETLLFKTTLIRLHLSTAESFGRLVISDKRIIFREAALDLERFLAHWRAGEPRSAEIRLGQLRTIRYGNWPGAPSGGQWAASTLQFVGLGDVRLTCQFDPTRIKRWRRAYSRIHAAWGDAAPPPG